MAVHVYKNISKTEIDLPTESGVTKIVPDGKYVGGNFYSFLQAEPAKWEHTEYSNPLDVAFQALVQSADMISYVRDVFGYSRVDVVPPASVTAAGGLGEVVILADSPAPGVSTIFACVREGAVDEFHSYEGVSLGTGDGLDDTFAAPADLDTAKDYTVYVEGVPLTRGVQAEPEDYYLDSGVFTFTVAPGDGDAITIDYTETEGVPNWATTSYANVSDGPDVS